MSPSPNTRDEIPVHYNAPLHIQGEEDVRILPLNLNLIRFSTMSLVRLEYDSDKPKSTILLG
jgi:hypothetical protein